MMWSIIKGAEAPTYDRFHLQIWEEPEDKHAPLIIVIPGFLTQEHPETPFEGWSEPFIKLAKEKGFAVGGLYWPSGTLNDFFEGEDLLSYVNVKLLSFGYGALRVWQKAVKTADEAGRAWQEWLPQTSRPVILVGHSLGARLALIAAQSAPKRRLSGLIALASAYEERLCDYNLLRMNVCQPPLISYSSGDMVLKTLFILGQNPEALALGLLARIQPEIGLAAVAAKLLYDYQNDIALGTKGVPKIQAVGFKSWDVSRFQGVSMGHNDYVKLLPKILQHQHVLSILKRASQAQNKPQPSLRSEHIPFASIHNTALTKTSKS